MNINATLAQQFIQKRQIPLIGGDITSASQELATGSIIYFNTLGVEPITLFLDSPGGDVKFADIIIDAVRLSEAPVHGIVVGYAYSSAFWILQNCHRRIARPSSRMMCHGTLLSKRIDEVAFTESLRTMRARLRKNLLFLAKRTRQPLTQWQKWSREERVFLGPEALKYGMVDEVASLPDLPGMSS